MTLVIGCEGALRHEIRTKAASGWTTIALTITAVGDCPKTPNLELKEKSSHYKGCRNIR